MQSAQEQPAAAPEGAEIPLGAEEDAGSLPRRDLAAALAAQDAELKRLAFAGGTADRVRLVEAHCTAIMRRAEAKDPRTALAAAKLLLSCHELSAKLSGEMHSDAENAAGRGATVVIFAGNPEAALADAKRQGKVIEGDAVVMLPDNHRGDGEVQE